MVRRKGFTLIELLVVIAIIALLMSILMPALGRVKRQARTSACLGLLRQWGVFFRMYVDEHDGYFMEGFSGVYPSGNNRWCKAMKAYHKWDSELTCCPNATKPWYEKSGADNSLAGTFRGSTTAWGYYQDGGWEEPLKGSYGINGWCNNPDPGRSHSGKPEEYHWRSPDIPGAAYVPLFTASQRYNNWPEHTDPPPVSDGQYWSDGSGAHIFRIVLNRHDGFINALFMDWSARKVGLKEIWTLKWHKAYNQAGPWTRAGGAVGSDWPEWMRPFKEY